MTLSYQQQYLFLTSKHHSLLCFWSLNSPHMARQSELMTRSQTKQRYVSSTTSSYSPTTPQGRGHWKSYIFFLSCRRATTRLHFTWLDPINSLKVHSSPSATRTLLQSSVTLHCLLHQFTSQKHVNHSMYLQSYFYLWRRCCSTNTPRRILLREGIWKFIHKKQHVMPLFMEGKWIVFIDMKLRLS